MNGVPGRKSTGASTTGDDECGGRGSGIDLRRSQQLSVERATTTTTCTPTLSNSTIDNFILANSGAESNARTAIYNAPFTLSAADNVIRTQPTSTSTSQGSTGRGNATTRGGGGHGGGEPGGGRLQQPQFQQQQPPTPTSYQQQWFYNTTPAQLPPAQQHTTPCYNTTSSGRVQSLITAGIPFGYTPTAWISAAELQHGSTRGARVRFQPNTQQQQPSFIIPYFGPASAEHHHHQQQLANQHAAPTTLSVTAGEQSMHGILPNIPALTYKTDHFAHVGNPQSGLHFESGNCDETHKSTAVLGSSQRGDKTDSRSSTPKLPGNRQHQQPQQQRAASYSSDGPGRTSNCPGTSSSGTTTTTPQRSKSDGKNCGKLSQKRFVYIFDKKNIIIFQGCQMIMD